MKQRHFFKIRIVAIILLLSFFSSCNREYKKQQKIKNETETEFQLALEKKDFTKAFESYYKLKTFYGDLSMKDYTEKLISARIPFLLFEDEYNTALRELVEFDYWNSYGASSHEFDFANGFLLKIFDSAIENRDFDAANKALKYFRVYHLESNNHKSLLGDPRSANFHEAEEYNQEVKKYNEQIVTSLESIKNSSNKGELIKWFDLWIKPVFNCVREKTGNGYEEKWYVSGYDKEYIENLKSRLRKKN